MKYILIAVILPILILGCSNTNNPCELDIDHSQAVAQFNDNHWNWGIWELAFTADHSQLEVVPKRLADYHYCVTKFMEVWPCHNCLSIGEIEVQPDKTIKFNVTLRHPFINAPKYTGFDVRGTVYFPGTFIQDNNELPYRSRLDSTGNLFPAPYYGSMPLIFSRAEQGGGEVLNPDGYSCYVIPGLTYSDNWQIYSYSEPSKNIKPTPELTTINPYKLFCSDLERRMFLVDDEITREYHIALPQGPFTFGYAVDASWWPPTNLPVTDPAVDFPPEANAEDPWLIEWEQLLPLCEENIDKNIFKATIHHRGVPTTWGTKIWSWDVTTGPYNPIDPIFHLSEDEYINEYTIVRYGKISYVWWYLYGKDGMIVPGNHFGILTVNSGMLNPPYSETTELECIIGARFVNIYVEG